MKRISLFALVFGLALVATPRISAEQARPDKAERFGLELQACQEALAAGTPGKCQLYGKIKIVEHHEDVKVKKVKHHEDIKVKWVDHHADEPGRWKRVEHHEKYKVKFVDHHEDHKIKIVEHHEGCD